ncbi:hypothetical protein ElP_27700 [Tautonia plasticadhaerens]|uniref:Uncharacterized protein n=1 Tax=Tautonia plasticadhaerens TaxID=2527974 RepID=A0A518H210_9BACT|nr:hypothetical protein ElP_27700 [Tautonia plasticadhaerens]
MIGAIFALEAVKSDDFRENLKRLVGIIQVKKLSSEDFYREFYHAASKAKHVVNISYLAPDPPGKHDHQYKKDYYKNLQTLICRNSKVTFRRIIRRTDENYAWACELLREFEGRANASIALINESDSTANPAALSVQVIDSRFAWFVAVKDHDQYGDWRDIFVENEQLAEAMGIYYERLWDRSDELLRCGKLTAEGRRLLAENAASTGDGTMASADQP